MEDIVKRALDFAYSAHSNGKRKGSGLPYIFHPIEVANIVATLTDDKEIIAAALLHDVVEDTDRTIDDIKYEFGRRVAAIVADESENKYVGTPKNETWKIRKIEQLQHFNECDISSKMVALGDKLSNIRSLRSDFYRLGDGVWQRFNQKDKNEHKWYYEKLVLILKRDFADTEAFKEFERLVSQVFSQNLDASI